ncbi:uncharacterized protein LTR77_000634 [Saxophila tyrrhenica]|uniref:Aminotransferase class V domain-containing protein n=1 Tax=Saxophila tyrrhenica TaxID=1690608 RepID=A0AAV9PRX7_9PEZI|nr:hypothetical protein LTR77_000634 [Saxophila tyrrhenica]
MDKSPMAKIAALEPFECGKDAARYFGFEHRNLNHGSFGASPTPVRSVQRYYQDLGERRPDAFIRYEYPQQLDVSRVAIAKYLNAPVETCVFVSNATIGINTVLRNIRFNPNDVIIYFATIYGACEKTVSYIVETTPAEAYKIQYTYPCSDADLCNAFEAAVKQLRSKGRNPRIAIFDTIVSLPGVRMPFERLTALCKKHAVLSCIDGAHGVGHVPLDLSKLDPDFFISNCHKWLNVPRGCAVFYVPLRNQATMRSTLPTSHGFVPLPEHGGGINNPLPPTGKSEYVTNFEFVGTLDDSPYLCIPAALEWRSKVRWNGMVGEEAIMGYCSRLARRAGAILSGILKTEVMENREGTLGNCNFSNVRLPLSSNALTAGDAAQIASIGQWIAKTLVQDYKTFIAIIYYDQSWWMRLSAQVYLGEEDFQWAGRVLAEVCSRVENGEWRQDRLASKL